MIGTKEADTCYAWCYQLTDDRREADEDWECVAVLKIPPVVSPETAVRAFIVSQNR